MCPFSKIAKKCKSLHPNAYTVAESIKIRSRFGSIENYVDSQPWWAEYTVRKLN